MEDPSSAPPSSSSPTQVATSSPAAADPVQPSKKGTGVFFGPALASRLAGSRSGSSRTQGAPNRSQSSSGSLGVNRHSSNGGPPRRRKSASLDLTSQEEVTDHLPVNRSTSFTAGGNSTHGAVLRPGSYSMPGGQELSMFQTLLPSSQARVASPSGTPFASGPVLSGSNLVPFMPNQQLALQKQQQHQQQQQQQQFALEHELLRQEQQRLQEVQQLQAELQRLLQQQQVRTQQHTSADQHMQLDAMVRRISGTGCAGGAGDQRTAVQTSPTLLAQLQMRPGQQQLLGEPVPGGGSQRSVLSPSPSAVLSCPSDALASELQQSCSLSISLLGGQAGGDLSTACGLPSLQSADLAAALQQKLQLQQANQLPILQNWSAQGAAAAAAAADDDAQVAALDGLINQCLARMLQLRSQMAARRAAAAAPMGSTCSTPTTTTAGAVLTTGAGVLSSAGAFTSDSGFLQPQAACSHPQAPMQQLHNGMLSPMSSVGAPMQQLSPMSSVGAPLQQQALSSDGRVMWLQQSPGPMHVSAGMVGSASGLAMSQQHNSACQPLQQGGSYCGPGGVVAQSMPLLVQQQGQPVLQQAGGVTLVPAYSMDDGARNHGYFSPQAGAAGQQGFSPATPAWHTLGQHMPMQAGPQGMVHQMAAGTGSSGQLDEQQLQQLQQLLAQQRLQGLLN